MLAAEHRWNADQAVMMLEDEDPDSFSFTDHFFAWRRLENRYETSERPAQIREIVR